MRSILSERNLVVLLFVLVLVTFSLAHEDTKKMEQLKHGVNSSATFSFQSSPVQSHSGEITPSRN